MVRDGVTVGQHLAQQLFLPGDPATYHGEGCLGTLLRKDVDRFVVVGVRPVREEQGDAP